MTGYTEIISTMWIDVWGNTLIGSIAILGVFAWLCCKKGLSVADSSAIMIPVIIGLTTSAYLPWWLFYLFAFGIGVLYYMAFMRLIELRG